MNEVCATSVNLSLTIITNQWTCRVFSYDLFLISSGIAISPHSRKDSHYQFTGLSANTRHSINVTFTSGVSVNTVSVGNANTLGSLCKFPKYSGIAIVYCTHTSNICMYVATYITSFDEM